MARKLLIALFLIVVAAAALNGRRIALREDITVMVPDALSPAIALFQRSPLAQKIFVVVKGPTPERARAAADLVTARFGALGMVPPKLDPETLLALHQHYTPRLWDAALARQAEPLLREENVAQKMRENLRLLSEPEGIFLRPWITADPLGLMPLFATRLQSLVAGSRLDASGGCLASPDGLKILLVFDAPGNPFESQPARNLGAALENMEPGTSAFLMGSARYTAENRRIIETDLARIFLLSCALLAGLFLWFFRDRHALLIYLIPPVTVLVAATGTSLIFGGLSGITLGFSAVLLGMASDYCTYVYFARRASSEADGVMRKLAPTITLSAVTLVLAFSLLGFSRIALFKQLATFVVIGLGVEWFVAVCIAPALFPCRAKTDPAFKVRAFLGPKTAAWAALLVLAAGAGSLPLVNFNFRLEALNTVSAAFDRDRREFEDLTGNIEQSNQFLFVFGKNREEALENNERLARKTPLLKLPALFVSEKTEVAHLRAWREFWTPERIGRLQALVGREAQKAGLKPSAFAPFFAFLRGETPDDAPPLETLYNPFVTAPDGRVAVFNILPEGAAVPMEEGVATLTLSQARIHEALYHHVTHRIALILAVLLGGATMLLWGVLKNLRHALLCLLPGVCGIALFAIVLAVSRAECNLFGFFILPMLIGIGINYGIFIVEQQTRHPGAHPTRAVLATALSTLAGFGALIVAQHKVLFILGLGAFTGILGALAASVFLLPALLQKSPARRAPRVPVAATLLLLLLAGCAGPTLRFARPPAKPAAGTRVEHAGIYRQTLVFRTLVVQGKASSRVVILSDLGFKLVDMNVTRQGTDIYFKSPAFPKIAVADFARFYAVWAFEKESAQLVRDGNETRYRPGGKELLWITNP